MSNHYMNKEMADRLFSCMREHKISTSDLCKVLNTSYTDFKATLEGRSPCFNKWQKKISEVLNTDRETLFKEFYATQKKGKEIMQIRVYMDRIKVIENVTKVEYNKCYLEIEKKDGTYFKYSSDKFEKFEIRK